VSGNAVLGSAITHTVTIKEPPFVIEFAVETSSVEEGESVTVAFAKPLPEGITPVISLGGSATSTVDYTYTITSTGIVITPLADGLYDPNETIVFTITGATGNAIAGVNNVHTVTITEPPLVVEFGTPASTIGEGEQVTIPYNMVLPEGVLPQVSLGGTATSGTDYTYSVTSTGIVVQAIADGLYDPNETIVLTLTSISGNAVLGTTVTHTITVTEPPLVVEFATPASEVNEGENITIPYTFTLPDGVLPVVQLTGTAINGTDYTYTVTASGIVVTTLTDDVFEANETIEITLTGVSGNAVLGSAITHTVTIKEPPFVIEFATETSSVEEGESVTVAFAKPLPEGITPVISLGGSATETQDYSYTITATGIVITAVADGLYDPNETIIITLTGTNGNAVVGAKNTHSVTVTEPPLVVEFAAPSTAILEGEQVIVPYNMILPDGVLPQISLAGTAIQPTDYSFTVSADGIVIQSLADELYEPAETIIITLTTISGNAVLGSLITHTVTITDPPLAVEFEQDTSTGTEGTTVSVAFTRELPDEVVPVLSFTGTASSGIDYTFVQTKQGVTLTLNEDWRFDPNETVIITITGVSGNAAVGSLAAHTLTIDDPQGTFIEFSAAASAVEEGTVIFVPLNPALADGGLPLFTLGGTAVAGIDYSYMVDATGFTITALEDAEPDVNETIIITLTGFSTSDYEIGAQDIHMVTIQDNAFIVEFAAETSSASEGQAHLIPFIRVLPAGVSISLNAGGTAIDGVDYTYSVSSTGITVNVIEDWIFDPDETVTFTITAVTGNTALGTIIEHTVTLIDPPSQLIEFTEAQSSETEGTTLLIPFNASLGNDDRATVVFGGTATEGVDYTYVNQANGISVTLMRDAVADPDETINFTLTGFNSSAYDLGTTTTHTLTINDLLITVGFQGTASSVTEGQSFTIPYQEPLPAGITPDISISGTAMQGSDYTYSLSAAGIVVTAVEDWSADPDETIEFTLTGVSGNAELGTVLSHTVTIIDPPAPVIEFVSVSSGVTEGQSVLLEYSAPLPAGVFPTFTVSGNAQLDVDYFVQFNTTGLLIIAAEDGNLDPDETLTVTLTGFTANNAAELGTQLSHTVTIQDAPMVIGLLSTSGRRTEGQSVIVAFNKQLPAGVQPIYTIGGTAISGVDYTVTQNTTGFIITVLRDELYDPEETVIIQLTGFTGNVVLQGNTQYTLTIQDEDETQTARLRIDLTWDSGNGTPGDVDMDIIVWYESSPGVYRFEFVADNPGPVFESVTIPSSVANGNWGLSYVYYSGTSDNVNFTVNLRSFKGNLNGTSNRAVYTGTYGLANRNRWDQTNTFWIAQTYTKAGNEYINVSPIATPAVGSRERTPDFLIDEQKLRELSIKKRQ
jgi:hypothetical protein